MWPNFAAYVVFFLTIGVIWFNHQATLRRLREADRSVLLVNVKLLMTTVILPFTTSLMARYLLDDTQSTVAAVVNGGSLLLRNLIGVAPCLLTTLGALISPYLRLAVTALVAISLMLPLTTPEAGGD